MNHFQMLAALLPPELRQTFRAQVDATCGNGCDIDDGFLGFIEDYQHLAAIVESHTIRSPKDHILHFGDRSWTVYDVGCCAGFQHILFPFADKYVGIDLWHEPTPLLPNATFIRGRFAEIVDTLDINPERSFGIANMSLLYPARQSDIDAFDRVFRHKYMM